MKVNAASTYMLIYYHHFVIYSFSVYNKLSNIIISFCIRENSMQRFTYELRLARVHRAGRSPCARALSLAFIWIHLCLIYNLFNYGANFEARTVLLMTAFLEITWTCWVLYLPLLEIGIYFLKVSSQAWHDFHTKHPKCQCEKCELEALLQCCDHWRPIGFFAQPIISLRLLCYRAIP